jgi:primosomal protein N' (replication factor Y)
MDHALENREQVLVFLNRRGSARLVLCEKCGWQALCPNCDVALTYHQDEHQMRCHSCDFRQAPPTACPDCGASELVFKSIGTKALESEIARLYPRARVSRFDRDTARNERLHLQHDALRKGDVDILIGTQAVAKGFDLPQLSVVGVIQADSGLQIPDFSAAERSYQLISQVSGRIGRGHRPGTLIVQTYHPDSELIRTALTKDYRTFYEMELKQRELFRFPPYYFLLKLTCTRASSRSARAACEKTIEQIRQASGRIIIEGPAPRFVERIAGRYAWHVIVKAKERSELLRVIEHLPANVTYDLDPSDLL